MSSKLIGSLLTLTMTACITSAPGSQYTNSEFGFSVSLPAGTSTCRSQAPEHDGGLNILLDAGSDGCEALQKRRFIGVYASYNAMLAPTAEEVLKLTDGHPAGEQHMVPPGLEIPGVKSASSRRDRVDGWVDIRVVAQHGQWPSSGDEPDTEIPYLTYEVMLHTTRETLGEDVERLRAVLRDVRILREE